jgi:hypothetical protein
MGAELSALTARLAALGVASPPALSDEPAQASRGLTSSPAHFCCDPRAPQLSDLSSRGPQQFVSKVCELGSSCMQRRFDCELFWFISPIPWQLSSATRAAQATSLRLQFGSFAGVAC